MTSKGGLKAIPRFSLKMCDSKDLPSSKGIYWRQRKNQQESCQSPSLTQMLLYKNYPRAAQGTETQQHQPKALTLHANKPLVWSECFIWFALSEVRPGQMLVVLKDESLMSGKHHFGENKVRVSLTSWSAGSIQIWISVLPPSAFILKKIVLQQPLWTCHYRIITCLGFRQQIHFFFLWPHKGSHHHTMCKGPSQSGAAEKIDGKNHLGQSCRVQKFLSGVQKSDPGLCSISPSQEQLWLFGPFCFDGTQNIFELELQKVHDAWPCWKLCKATKKIKTSKVRRPWPQVIGCR